MNPETLREFAEKLRLVEAAYHSEAVQSAATRRMLDAAADAWEADIKDAKAYEKMANHNADVIDNLRKRLEAAEKELADIAQHGATPEGHGLPSCWEE